jgi:cysteinyl-tRNA synthetase
MRAVRLHDTRTGELMPLSGARVGIYACGPTVYSRIHVGNARPFVVFSLLKRFLEHEGYEVALVANITDINDKIYDAARAAGVASDALAREMTEHYERDTARLELGRPDHEPKATEYVEEIVALIEALIAREHAYEADGDVYFRVRSLDGYGGLSHQDIEQMDQGEGVEGSERKEDPLDFALWKARKPDEDTSWPSPWGAGRPGWHIECSAMAESLLGLEFAVHGGGSDLIFPHHENEAAQTQGARGRPLARIWMHNGMLELPDDEAPGPVAGDEARKMSKSLGNVRGLAQVLDGWGRDALVTYFCEGHYRQPLAFTPARLDEAARRVARIREAGRRLVPGESPPELAPLQEAFFDALADDFNTPRALAVMADWIREANGRADRGEAVGDAGLRDMLGVLGLENLLAAAAGPPPEIVDLAERRAAARAERDWATADSLRDELRARGWEVRDGAGGPELVATAT